MFQKSAEKEYEAAQYSLGNCYQNGIGVEKNETRAFEYYEKSAEKGFSMAQNTLGSLYEIGKYIEKDLEKAIYWYNQAAKNGNEMAQFNLGICYQNGIGVEKDETKAFEYRPKRNLKMHNFYLVNLNFIKKHNLNLDVVIIMGLELKLIKKGHLICIKELLKTEVVMHKKTLYYCMNMVKTHKII